MTQRYNVLYLHSHDTGRYVQPYGYALATPNYQQLAEAGILFRQAFCAAPTCSPSRAALLTGTWPHTNGMIGLAHRGSRLREPRWHLASYLHTHGYHTVLCGFQHEATGADIEWLGYQRILDRENPPSMADRDEATACRAARFLSSAPPEPFFLSCGFLLTHRTGRGIQWHNHDRSPLGDPRYVRPPATLPDLAEIRRDFADFLVAVQRLDQCVGIVLEALHAAGLTDRTLVVATTDHGIAFPGMKCNLSDGGTGVLLIVRGPGGFRGGRVVDALVSQVDLYPTICHVVGLPVPPWVQGVSLLPLLEDSTQAVRDAVFAEINYHACAEPARAVRTQRYKYIRRWHPRSGPVLPNCDDSPSKEVWLHYGWAERPQTTEMLFDLVFDPQEACNVAEDPAYAPALEEMRSCLRRWMEDTADPLLGPGLRPWPGMVVNPFTSSSPQGPTQPAEALPGGWE